MSKVRVFPEASDNDSLLVENVSIGESFIYVLPRLEVVKYRMRKMMRFTALSALLVLFTVVLSYLLEKRIDAIVPIPNELLDFLFNLLMIASFVGVIVLEVTNLRKYFERYKDELWEKSCVMIRRKMKANSSGVFDPEKTFYISDKMFSSGTEGDFVTFYKGEMLKKNMTNR